MKNLSKVIIACFVSLIILSSCSKENDRFALDPNVISVNSERLLEDNETVESVKTPLIDDYDYEGIVISTKNNRPIYNAIVSINAIDKNGGTISKTDRTGGFSLRLNTFPDKVEIKVEKQGYVTQIINLADLDENTVYLVEKRRPVSNDILEPVSSVD